MPACFCPLTFSSTHNFLPRSALAQKVEALEAAASRLSKQALQVQVQQLPALQQQYSGIAGALTQLQDVQTRSLRVKATLDGLARGVEGQHGAKPL